MNIFYTLMNIGVPKTGSEKELRRVKVLNLITYIALVHAIFFLSFDFLTDSLNAPKTLTLVLEIVFFGIILYFQHVAYFKLARILFTVTVFFNLLFHCNYAFQGYYGEYQYLVIPLFSLFLFDKNYIHYVLLFLAIAAFYIPNYLLGIYPERYFGYLNVLLLFIGVFLIVNFFKITSEKNEKKLGKQLAHNLEMQTDLDQANKELKSLNTLQNHFFVNIAHELGTPITLLKGQAWRLLKNADQGQMKTGLEKMNLQVVKLETLLGNIMDIAKMEVKSLVLNKDIYAANQLVQHAFTEFQPLFQQKNIEFSIALSDGDPHILVDKLYFDRVLGNLLANAFKYTDNGGLVSIKILEIENRLQIAIIDNGIGVPEADLELIFDRFYQSKNHINTSGGSGIGLAFSKEIIAMHSGELHAHQNTYGGLTITMRIPLVVKNINTPNDLNTIKERVVKINPFCGKTILLVDDNAEMREYLSLVLHDFRLIEASNGREALEQLEKQTVDAIVTDYMMPVMDGRSLVHEVKKLERSIPIIMITARVDIKNKLEMLRLGIDDYLTKPFSEEELVLRLQNTMVNQAARTAFMQSDHAHEPMAIDVDEHSMVIRSKNIVLTNIDNPYFGVAQLSDALHISERTLYRILKKETGLSPNVFIRELKLLEVRALTERNKALSLQELALSVGLTNGTYLNQLYKDRFGKALNA